jgi:endonuclease YncB( thermonuclease family)
VPPNSAGDFRSTARPARWRTALLAAGLLLAGLAPAAAQDFSGLARVRGDGSLIVGNRLVRLHGIWIPLLERTCRSTIRPPDCGYESVLVLERLARGFVHCDTVRQLRGGSVEAVCSVRGRGITSPRQDLAATLLVEGFAFAAENAPGQYRLLERLAERRGSGLWSEGIVNLR